MSATSSRLAGLADGRWEGGIMDVRLVPRIAGALLLVSGDVFVVPRR